MSVTVESRTVVLAVAVAVAVVALWAGAAEAHGRLIEPPSRGSMWRYGFNTPADYTDNQHNCGGVSKHYGTNKGKCGVCGDAYDAPVPRPHERGGRYGRGPLVRTYGAGQTVDVVIDLTANHKGWFEFRLCPTNNPNVRATQECLEKNILHLAGSSSTKFKLTTSDSKKYTIKVNLPTGLVCSHCVLQWKYRGGNNWGMDSEGQGIGHGNQEEFYGCADIRISGNGGPGPRATRPPPPVPRATRPPPPAPRATRPPPGPGAWTTTTTTWAPPVGGHCRFLGVGPWKGNSGMDRWCEANCRHIPPFCPPSRCVKVC